MTPFGLHAAGQHMTVIAIGGDDGIFVSMGRLHADNNGFLADIEVAKSADQAHAVELAGLFLKPADQQHLAVIVQQFVFAGLGLCSSRSGAAAFCGCHPRLPNCVRQSVRSALTILSPLIFLCGPPGIATALASKWQGVQSGPDNKIARVDANSPKQTERRRCKLIAEEGPLQTVRIPEETARVRPRCRHSR